MRKVAVAIASSLFAVALVGISPPSFASETADECVVVYQNDQDKGIDFELKNNCDKPLSCAIKYTVSCENASGKTTSSTKKDARFGVNAATTHHEKASAASCNDGWKVEDVSWDCAPNK